MAPLAMREGREMQVGDLVRVKLNWRNDQNIGIITKITIAFDGRRWIEVNCGNYIYRRFPSALEALCK